MAAINAPGQTVLSGDRAEIDALAVALTERGVAHRRLEVSHAFHSAHMEEAAARVVQAWQRTTSCQDGPNMCMRYLLASCNEAMREIGPEGVRYPGLIGFSP